jgi:carboxyl-terminal processing protease
MSQRAKFLAISLLLLIIVTVSFGAGYLAGGWQFYTLDNGISKVVEAWDIILDNYVTGEEIDVDALAEAAVQGMIDELADPHSEYLNPQAYKSTLEGFEGSYEGIGAEVALNDEGQVVIISPYAGSPAAEAGILPGDIILAVNNQPTEGISLAEVVALVRGPKGTTVVLLVKHDDSIEAEEIPVTRDEIELTTVSLMMMGSLAHLSIGHFTENTSDELDQAMQEMQRQGASAIILDLRHNPGGRLLAVVNVASHFMSDGVILTVIDNSGHQDVYEAVNQDITTSLPLVVLVDSFSASGSEVLAGALQDNGRAQVAGTVTFGKGSVNQLFQLQDGSGIYLTIARWYTPDGRLIEGQGITPDFVLELTGDDLTQWAIDYLSSN